MAYLTSQLITDAYYTSSIVSREFETVTGSQLSDGLRLLNEVIADRTIDNGTIPYTAKLEFNAVIGQASYALAGLIDVDVFVFYINGIRFETQEQQLNEFHGSNRATDINSLPFNWNVNRGLNGSTLYLYFVPDTTYPLEIWGKFRLLAVTEFQDLDLTLDTFYQNFLKYLLIKRLCQYNSFKVPADVQKQLDNYNQWITNTTNEMDLRTQTWSSLSGGAAINYGVVNLSNGYFPIK